MKEDDWDILFMLILVAILGMVAFSGCAPATQPVATTPKNTPNDTLSRFAELAHQGTATLDIHAGELPLDGASLVIPETTKAKFFKVPTGIEIRFDDPRPRGKITKLGIGFSAGIESLLIENNRITATTDRLGRRFVWELKEMP